MFLIHILLKRVVLKAFDHDQLKTTEKLNILVIFFLRNSPRIPCNYPESHTISCEIRDSHFPVKFAKFKDECLTYSFKGTMLRL